MSSEFAKNCPVLAKKQNQQPVQLVRPQPTPLAGMWQPQATPRDQAVHGVSQLHAGYGNQQQLISQTITSNTESQGMEDAKSRKLALISEVSAKLQKSLNTLYSDVAKEMDRAFEQESQVRSNQKGDCKDRLLKLV